MELTPMRLFAVVFFVSMPVWIVLTIAAILTPTSGVAKADGLFAVLAVGSLLLMAGMRLYERSTDGPTTHHARPGGFSGPSA